MLSHSIFLALWQTASHTDPRYPPIFPLGALVAWFVCSRQKRSPIGGWLLFYFWQLYGGLLLTLIFFAINIASYVPENFQDKNQFYFYIAAAVPTIVLIFIQGALASLLLSVRTWDMLKLLRWVLLANLVAQAAGLIIDVGHFPANIAFRFPGVVAESLWLAYLFRSRRVRHVFLTHDWNAAVDTIYPPAPTLPRIISS
jgi:hypothetical protein